MIDSAVPGVYVAEQQYTLNPLKIDTRCLTGFVGISERGPINVPTLIHSFDEYLRIFGGFDGPGVLAYSVYGYYKCGGDECVIVRVADENVARKAALKLPCVSGSASLEALSSGTWGNYISCRTWIEAEPVKGITSVDIARGAWIECGLFDVAPGDTLRLFLLGQTVFRDVSRVDSGRIYFDRPLKLLKRIRIPGSDMKAESVFFSLILSCRGKSESYLHLSMNPSAERYFPRYVNERSLLCKASVASASGPMLPVFSQYAAGGIDGAADLGARDFIGFYRGPNEHKGLGSLESRDDISLIAMPDVGWLLAQPGKNPAERERDVFAVQDAMIRQAERFPGRFAILDAPTNGDSDGVLEWARRLDSGCAAAYYPFIDMIEPQDRTGSKTVRIPPSGAVCGCIVACDSEKGIFHAPANVTVQGAAGVSSKIPDADYERLYAAGVNLLKYFPGKGIKIWGARTLASNPDWKYINVRRTFSRISSSIKQGTQWAVFEPNNKNLRKRLVRQVSGFLLDLWMAGYLAGSTAEQGFYVRCDEELNPPENIDDGILTFEIGLAVSKPTEFFRILITAEKEGASVYIQDE